MMSIEKSSFQYFISEKDDFLVVSMLGVISRSIAPELEKCRDAIDKSRARHVVLTFHDVSSVETGAIAALVKLQKAIRDRGSQLRICFIRPEVHRVLVDAGAIRESEIRANLLAALQSFNSDKPVAE